MGGKSMSKFVSGYYRLALWIPHFAYLNLLWVVFTVVGLIFFGFLPATAAMFAVVRKWIGGEADIPVLPTFWKSYRKEFVKINIIGYIVFIIGYLLTIELQILKIQEHIAYYIGSFCILHLFIVYSIFFLYLFSNFVIFIINLFNYFTS